MRIQVLEEALVDLGQGFRFYESQEAGLGAYFLEQLFFDIDSLRDSAGIHPLTFSHHRALSKRFPFAIYYSVKGEFVRVHAVMDCRRKPSWIRRRLEGGI